MKRKLFSLTLALCVCLGLCALPAAASGTGSATVQLNLTRDEPMTLTSSLSVEVFSARSDSGGVLTVRGGSPSDMSAVTAYGTLRGDPSVTATCPGWINGYGAGKIEVCVPLFMGDFHTVGTWDVYVTFPAYDGSGAEHLVTSNTFSVTLGHSMPMFLQVRKGQTPVIDAAAGTATWTNFTLEVTDAYGNFCGDYQTNTAAPQKKLGDIGPVTVRSWDENGCPFTAADAPVVNGVAVIDKLVLTNRTGAAVKDPRVDFLLYYAIESYSGDVPSVDLSWLRTPKTEDNGGMDSQGEYVFYGLTVPAAGSAAEPPAAGFVKLGIDPEASGAAHEKKAQPLVLNGVSKSFNAYALRNTVGDTNYIRFRDLAYLLDGTDAQFNVKVEDGNIRLEPKTKYEPVAGDTEIPFSGDQAYAQTTRKLLVGDETVELTAFTLANGGHTYVKIVDLAQVLNFRVWFAGGAVNVDTAAPFDPADFS